ncbi:hypothetical protein Tco_0053898 [Tanacetum coccineum]
MESSSSNSEESELQQMQLKERQLHSKCMAWFKELKIHLETLHNNRLSVASLVTKGATLEASLVTKGAALEASLVTEGVALDASLVTEGIALDASLVAKQSIVKSNTSSEQQNECNSSRNECSISENENRSSDNEIINSGNDAYADIRPSHDIDTVSENNSNIISDIPNMDPARDKEEHDYVDYEQQHAFFISLINNLKWDVEKCTKVNREAQQANALLTKELERYKETEKHFAKDKTMESEYCKKIKLLNDRISNLKSQACQNDKTFAKENGKYDEYVQSLLKRKNEFEKKNQEFLKQINDLDDKLQKARQTDQTLQMFLPKKDNVNTGKQGLGFENQNDVVNPSLLNKAKKLAPCLYNTDEMGKDMLSDHKIISDEELKFEAKQSNPPQEDVFINSSFEDNVKRIARNRLSKEFEPLVKDVNLQLNCFKKVLVKEMKDDLQYVMSLEDDHVYENEIFEQNSSLENENRFLKNTITELSKQTADVKEEMTKRCSQYEKDFVKLEAHCISLELKSQKKSLTSVQNGQVLSNKSDEAKIKFDIKDLETINIELEYSVASLLKENEHLKMIYQNMFDSIKCSRVQTKSSNVSQNKAENLKSQLSEFADKKFDKVFQKIESMKKKTFASRITSDFLQKSLYDSGASNVQSKSGEKRILFGNDTSSFETKIKELETILAQQTKDFKDAKVNFSKKTNKFETYFEKLKNTRVVLEQQLDHKI